ncbi:hypothetical protein BDY17DRAFT_62313 [Neohortaea acidophila]|uniref:Uncharacterized protein n=1 Tax=Neohortaea acidophila TaxID=245834 RepID=A0A6A6PEW6_9PEZI|nr:uncharacterized protein BDY17DRAFT_62313 [Neohortaea acidophila]KAF2478519.1 hypothetical protein BDY17DRAFT_62313 [Neohortaea acidophila]
MFDHSPSILGAGWHCPTMIIPECCHPFTSWTMRKTSRVEAVSEARHDGPTLMARLWSRCSCLRPWHKCTRRPVKSPRCLSGMWKRRRIIMHWACSCLERCCFFNRPPHLPCPAVREKRHGPRVEPSRYCWATCHSHDTAFLCNPQLTPSPPFAPQSTTHSTKGGI